MAKQNKAAEMETPVAETATETVETVQAVKAEPTSEKLESLKALLVEKQGAVRQLAANPDTPYEEVVAATLETVKINGEIKAEINAIHKAEIEAALAEKRNARIALVDNFEKAISDGNAEAYAEAREALVNAVLGSQPARIAAVRSSNGSTGNGSPRGGISAEIRSMLPDLYAAGKTGAEVRSFIIKEKGYNDGTANAVIKQYERDNGLS